MAGYRMIEGRTKDELLIQLNGGVQGNKNLAGLVYGLHGLTLITTTPNFTVTFSDASNAGLTIQQICTAINAVTTPKIAFPLFSNTSDPTRQSFLTLIDGSGGIVVSKDGTANTILGFSTSAATTGTPVVLAKIAGTFYGVLGQYAVLVAP